ncbi:translation elongation factor Ts [Rhabdaerophilum sp. SD176]|uniref:translation elongation factor Ts n=1 Tax=Rhabdaerophilum sp. SD176 TaxID=2983548 RepID=UPI0024DFCD9C|nr:translation elongation factor Ts [Rhabdaerophilum sp. SD176]
MAAITASMVSELRQATGAGMMDCKAALTETGGDIEAAVDWLRKKGLAKAAKKAGRVAAEGLVGIAVSGTRGVVVEVNSETDFVARNEQFQELVRSVAGVALGGNGDVEALKNAAHPAGGTVQEAVANAVATVGENMTLRRVGLLNVSQGVVASYMHNSVGDGLGKIGVLVALESSGNAEALQAIGRQVAMHIAATNPQGLDGNSIDPAIVERERAVLADKARSSGKPEAVIEKIVESGIKTFFKEVTLVDQPFVHDSSKTVAQAVNEAAKAAGAPIVLKGYLRFGLGEGIEKETSDFAAEVAAAAGGNA